MRVLVYGAGVIGSIYAAHLHEGGLAVSVLARGRRLEEIREHGIRVESADAAKRIEADIPTVDRLESQDAYDLVVVAMQKGHLAPVLPILAANRQTPTILFLGNNAAGPEVLLQALGPSRVLMGFPGVGGYFDGSVVRFAAEGRRGAPLGLTLGEVDGRKTLRLRTIVRELSDAGIRVSVEPSIDAWLKGHVALVLPVLFALEQHDLDNQALAGDRDAMRRMARAVREGLSVLRTLGYPITPPRLKTITWLPLFVTVAIFGKIIGSDFAKVAFAGHARSARAEFELLRNEFRDLIASAGLAAPAFDELCGTPRGHQGGNP